MSRQLVRVIGSFLIWCLRISFQLVTLCVVSIWVGIPEAVERITNTWLMEVTALGFPLGYSAAFRTATKLLAYVSIILGWLVLASISFLLLKLIF